MTSKRLMPTRDVFLDTETGGLRTTDTVWEFGAVVDGPGDRHTRHLHHPLDFDAGKADAKILADFGFLDRHPRFATPAAGWVNQEGRWVDDHGLRGESLDVPVDSRTLMPYDLALHIERMVRGARIIVCNAVFDVPKLTAMLAEVGVPWTGHYRVICATTYAAGVVGMDPSAPNDQIGEALGVARDAHGVVHSALVDSLYARDLYLAALAKVGIKQADTWQEAA